MTLRRSGRAHKSEDMQLVLLQEKLGYDIKACILKARTGLTRSVKGPIERLFRDYALARCKLEFGQLPGTKDPSTFYRLVRKAADRVAKEILDPKGTWRTIVKQSFESTGVMALGDGGELMDSRLFISPSAKLIKDVIDARVFQEQSKFLEPIVHETGP